MQKNLLPGLLQKRHIIRGQFPFFHRPAACAHKQHRVIRIRLKAAFHQLVRVLHSSRLLTRKIHIAVSVRVLKLQRLPSRIQRRISRAVLQGVARLLHHLLTAHYHKTHGVIVAVDPVRGKDRGHGLSKLKINQLRIDHFLINHRQTTVDAPRKELRHGELFHRALIQPEDIRIALCI